MRDTVSVQADASVVRLTMVHQGRVSGVLPNGGMQLAKAASSLRPHIVQVMAARQGRILTTEEIYELVAASGVADFNPNAKRDRNLVNRELSDLAGCTTQGHSKPSPQLIMRVSRGPLPVPRTRSADGRGAVAGVPGAGGGIREATGPPAWCR